MDERLAVGNHKQLTASETITDVNGQPFRRPKVLCLVAKPGFSFRGKPRLGEILGQSGNFSC
jgi:hypothetical protein